MRKRNTVLWMMAFVSMGFVSCSGDDDQGIPVATVSVEARSMLESETDAPSVVGGANFLSAGIRVRDLAIVPEGEPLSSSQPVGDGGAQHIVLLNSGLPANPTTLGSTTVNHGDYDRLTMRLDRGQQLPESDENRNRSVYITGTVNGMLLHIYTDVEEIVTRTLESSAQTINSNEVLYLNFDMNELFDGIDLRTAVDGNDDGTVEIEPSNTDDNRLIYIAMVNNLPNAITVTRE